MKIFGITPGEKVGAIKSAIEEAILNGEIENNYDDAKAFILQNRDSFV